MDDYPMGDLRDLSALKPETPNTPTYPEWEAKCNATMLEDTIKWLQRRMSPYNQCHIMLDQMSYDCIAVIPTGKDWRDRLLQVL